MLQLFFLAGDPRAKPFRLNLVCMSEVLETATLAVWHWSGTAVYVLDISLSVPKLSGILPNLVVVFSSAPDPMDTSRP